MTVSCGNAKICPAFSNTLSNFCAAQVGSGGCFTQVAGCGGIEKSLSCFKIKALPCVTHFRHYLRFLLVKKNGWSQPTPDVRSGLFRAPKPNYLKHEPPNPSARLWPLHLIFAFMKRTGLSHEFFFHNFIQRA